MFWVVSRTPDSTGVVEQSSIPHTDSLDERPFYYDTESGKVRYVPLGAVHEAIERDWERKGDFGDGDYEAVLLG